MLEAGLQNLKLTTVDHAPRLASVVLGVKNEIVRRTTHEPVGIDITTPTLHQIDCVASALASKITRNQILLGLDVLTGRSNPSQAEFFTQFDSSEENADRAENSSKAPVRLEHALAVTRYIEQRRFRLHADTPREVGGREWVEPEPLAIDLRRTDDLIEHTARFNGRVEWQASEQCRNANMLASRWERLDNMLRALGIMDTPPIFLAEPLKRDGSAIRALNIVPGIALRFRSYDPGLLRPSAEDRCVWRGSLPEGALSELFNSLGCRVLGGNWGFCGELQSYLHSLATPDSSILAQAREIARRNMGVERFKFSTIQQCGSVEGTMTVVLWNQDTSNHYTVQLHQIEHVRRTAADREARMALSISVPPDQALRPLPASAREICRQRLDRSLIPLGGLINAEEV